MPRLMKTNLTPLAQTLLNTIYTLTLSACNQAQSLPCQDYDVFITSKNIRVAMGVSSSSTYQNKLLADLADKGWLKRIKRFEGYPNGMFYYALTREGYSALAMQNRAFDFLINAYDENRIITINGQAGLFDMTGKGESSGQDTF